MVTSNCMFKIFKTLIDNDKFLKMTMWRRTANFDSTCCNTIPSSRCIDHFGTPQTVVVDEDLIVTLASGEAYAQDSVVFTVLDQAILATPYGNGGAYTIPVPEDGWQGASLVVEMRYDQCPPLTATVSVIFPANCLNPAQITYRSTNLGRNADLDTHIPHGVGQTPTTITFTVLNEATSLQVNYDPNDDPLNVTLHAPEGGWAFEGAHVVQIQFGQCPQINSPFNVSYSNECPDSEHVFLEETTIQPEESLLVILDDEIGDVSVMVELIPDEDTSNGVTQQYFPDEEDQFMHVNPPEEWSVGAHTLYVFFGSCEPPLSLPFTVEALNRTPGPKVSEKSAKKKAKKELSKHGF